VASAPAAAAAAEAAQQPAGSPLAAQSAEDAALVGDPPSADKLPGWSPVDLYLQFGLGFAFMKLGSADAKRIVRAAAAAAKLPLSANAGWDKQEWAAASEQLQLQWLPEGTHSCTLPAMGRGVRAAWGAGRVYLYAPAPVDRFMQTPLIKAGFCDAALRPATAPRGEPFAAWSRTIDALAEAAASNSALRAALLADAVFPKELLPPEEEDSGDADASSADVASGREMSAAERWAAEEGGADALADFTDDDSIFAPAAAAPERARANFAPNGMKLPKTEMLSQPWNEPVRLDLALNDVLTFSALTHPAICPINIGLCGRGDGALWHAADGRAARRRARLAAAA
jgi:hypothetical protein